ncbi:MAG: hypothetical protein M3Q63_01540 [bacterium]|nr:hypothetical protein [bacterium]
MKNKWELHATSLEEPADKKVSPKKIMVGKGVKSAPRSIRKDQEKLEKYREIINRRRTAIKAQQEAVALEIVNEEIRDVGNVLSLEKSKNDEAAVDAIMNELGIKHPSIPKKTPKKVYTGKHHLDSVATLVGAPELAKKRRTSRSPLVTSEEIRPEEITVRENEQISKILSQKPRPVKKSKIEKRVVRLKVKEASDVPGAPEAALIIEPELIPESSAPAEATEHSTETKIPVIEEPPAKNEVYDLDQSIPEIAAQDPVIKDPEIIDTSNDTSVFEIEGPEDIPEELLVDISPSITETGLMSYEDALNTYELADESKLDEISETLLTHEFTLKEIKERLPRAKKQHLFLKDSADKIRMRNNGFENDKSMGIRVYEGKYRDLVDTLETLENEEENIVSYLTKKQEKLTTRQADQQKILKLNEDLRIGKFREVQPQEEVHQEPVVLNIPDNVEVVPKQSRVKKFFSSLLGKFASKKKLAKPKTQQLPEVIEGTIEEENDSDQFNKAA